MYIYIFAFVYSFVFEKRLEILQFINNSLSTEDKPNCKYERYIKVKLHKYLFLIYLLIPFANISITHSESYLFLSL